jgi:hypothetical protein
LSTVDDVDDVGFDETDATGGADATFTGDDDGGAAIAVVTEGGATTVVI